MFPQLEKTQSINGSGRPTKPAEHMQKNVAGLLHDLTGLAELQGQLLVHDVKNVWAGSKLALVFVIVGVVMALSSVPVMFIGIGWLLAETTAISHSTALIGTAIVVGICPAIGLVWFGAKQLQTHVQTLQRSTEELSHNLAWFKKAIRSRAGK